MTDTVPVDHRGLEVLASEECLRLLAGSPVGRLAFMEDGSPTILPVNHAMDGWTVVFRTAHGAKLDAASMARSVAFEVDGYDEERRTGWSVVVRGIAEYVWDPEEVARLAEIDIDPWADTRERDRWVRIHPDEITGRRIVRGPRR